jgi:hypothetical protein
MNKLWIVLLLLVAGCNGQADAQFQKLDLNPTAIDFGDSVSLEYWSTARKDLSDSVDFTHDKDDGEDQNDGCMRTMLGRMRITLDNSFYTVIVFNSGVHDIQTGISAVGCGQTPLDTYREEAEKAADIAGQHATYVIIADTISIRAGDLRGVPAGAQVPYNQKLHEVAREHGFYSWTPIWEGRSRYGNVHLDGEGTGIMG